MPPGWYASGADTGVRSPPVKRYHEKQVVLLTRENCELEQALEMQLRELTLLPLNIKYHFANLLPLVIAKILFSMKQRRRKQR
jgi:hypothetical protein